MGIGENLYNMAKKEIIEAKKSIAFFPTDRRALLFQKEMKK